MGNNLEKELNLGKEPAFPNTDCETFSNDGMSKRFYAACAAMQGILANQHWADSMKIKDDWDEFKDRVISGSYELANELLKQENA